MDKQLKRRGKEKQMIHQQRKDAMTVNNQHISVISLNVNGLKFLIKRQTGGLQQKT